MFERYITLLIALLNSMEQVEYDFIVDSAIVSSVLLYHYLSELYFYYLFTSACPIEQIPLTSLEIFGTCSFETKLSHRFTLGSFCEDF